MNISSQFDGGNIIVDNTDNPEKIRLRIRDDSESQFKQWFHFRASVQTGVEYRFEITNAGECSYADAWDGYRAVASYNRKDWFRVPTEYRDGVLSICHRPAQPVVFYAYFAPYPYERHLDLVHEAMASAYCHLHTLGQTVQGRNIDYLKIGTPGAGKKNVWVIARQHPGETMAEWCAEGLLKRLLDPADAVAAAVREHCVVHFVPSMNPDGGALGNLRANAAGVNLNRAWLEPDADTSPEVWYVRQAMFDTGVDAFLDLHGDEAIAYNFIAGSEGVPGYTPRLAELEKRFKEKLLAVTPEFQLEHGYPLVAAGEADMRIAGNWVAQEFNCLALTVEMPFKDNLQLPEQESGWSPVRCQRFGGNLLEPLLDILPVL